MTGEAVVGEWLACLRAVCREAGELDPRAYEDGPDERLVADLGPRVLGVLLRATALLQDLHTWKPDGEEVAGDAPEHHERHVRDFSFRVDALVAQEGEATRLSELMAMAGFHLSMKTTLVRNALHKDRWELLDACHSALRGTRKALVALEHVACEERGEAPLLDYRTELDLSLQVRLAFAKFREAVRSVLPAGAPAEGAGPGIVRLLQGGSTALAVLVGRDAYPHLRARDRRQIRALQHKLLSAMRAQGAERDAMGRQALADLAVFAELVSLVNQREELIEHDRRLVREALEGLRALAPDDTPPPAWTEALKPLRGRDGDLDQLILRPRGAPARLWASLLQPLVGEELPSQV